MGFQYRNSIGFGPFRVNVSNRGVGWSVGGKGFRTGMSGSGRRYSTFSIFSGRKTPKKGVRAVFFCFRVPRPDPALIETADGAARWSESAGETVWVCTDPEGTTVANSPKPIALGGNRR